MKTFAEIGGLLLGKPLLSWGCLAVAAGLFITLSQAGVLAGVPPNLAATAVLIAWACLLVSTTFFFGNVTVSVLPKLMHPIRMRYRNERMLRRFQNLDSDGRVVLLHLAAQSSDSLWLMADHPGASALRGCGLATVSDQYRNAIELTLIEAADDALQANFAKLDTLQCSIADIQRLEISRSVAYQALEGRWKTY